MNTDSLERVWTVTSDDTAIVLGSGSVAVLGTPRVIAWMEACCVRLVEDRLPDGMITVGTEIAIRHMAPSPVGAQVHVVATLDEADGRRWKFRVAAVSDGGSVLAKGTATRVSVSANGFGK